MAIGGRGELDAAGIVDPTLRLSYAACRRLNARHGRTYYLATLLLPPAKRPFVHALYGFARHADDIVDELDLQPSGEARVARFTGWSEAFLTDLERGRSSDSVAAAVVDTARRWRLPAGYFVSFLDSMRADLTVTEYQTFVELRRYMWGSAAVIGLQMLPILGRADPGIPWATLEPYATDLGFAFQLTNFIRDVGEDLRRGRIYLPQESLRGFGVDRERLARRRVDEPIRRLLAHEIERARSYYQRAAPGIELVHPTSRDCLHTAATLYGEILDVVERRQYDVFGSRTSVAIPRRLILGSRGFVSARRARYRYPAGRETPTSTR
jgi:15-cis-phytoene synthase